MKKSFTLFLLLAMGILSHIQAQIMVQGMPYSGKIQAPKIITANPTNTGFTMDDIKFWVGEGENQAALIIQWNDEREENTYVWGYRWTGEATGYDMLAAIVKADKRLYYLTHKTNLGNTVAGIGFDLDGDGDIALKLNREDVAVNSEGYAVTTSYNYDDFSARDADDLWMSGWFTNGYWSYYGNNDGTFPPSTYATAGASSRKLQNNSVDGWWFAAGMTWDPATWNSLAAIEKPSLPRTFTNGFFLQNEDWFGHAQGSINWIDNQTTPYYNIDNKANNNTEILGNTSQYGCIYGDYYYAVSKQSPCLVIMDAQTMKVVKSFEKTGNGDGRSIVGINENKLYIGSTAGIYVLNTKALSLSSTAIEGTTGTSQYSGQIGIMQRVGKYVFAAKQSTGILVIDPETDTVIQTIENSKICGLTVSRTGMVWAVATSDIIRIDPMSLEHEVIALPNSMVSVWGTWMPDKICADPDEDALYYAYGSNWPNGEKFLGKLLIGADGSLTEDPNFIFTMPAAVDENQYQIFYGMPGIDPQSGYLLITTTQSGYGANYSYNWLHFIDRSTGTVVKTITLTNDEGENYYWFPSMPVFPDNHAPEIHLENIQLSGIETISLTDIVEDKDNLSALAVCEATSENTNIFTVENDGLHLTLKPVSIGTGNLAIRVNSNGKITEQNISVNVSGTTTNITETNTLQVFPNPFTEYIVINLAADQDVTIYGSDGKLVSQAHLHAGENQIELGHLGKGIYILKAGNQTVKLVK